MNISIEKALDFMRDNAAPLAKAEAERIEEGCKADYEVIDNAIKETFERIAKRIEK